MSRTQRKFAQGADIVRPIINEWDPYQLFAGRAVDDEYEHEILSVARQILERARSENDVIHIVSRVYALSFGDAEQFSIEACHDVGTRIFQAIKAEQLLPDEL